MLVLYACDNRGENSIKVVSTVVLDAFCGNAV